MTPAQRYTYADELLSLPAPDLALTKFSHPLGAGGIGEIYSALDRRLDRKVAIKILPEHLSEKPESRERFEREARAISSLNHPNICQLYDVGEQNGPAFL